MAAVPPNPYQGLNGLQNAWSRLVQWVTRDLPDQWLRIQEVIDYVGGVGAVPPQAPPSGPSLIQSGQWTREDYLPDPADTGAWVAIAQQAASYRYEWNFGRVVTIGAGPQWIGAPSFDLMTAVAQNYDVMVGPQFVTVWPDGTGPVQRPGELLWEPGYVVQW